RELARLGQAFEDVVADRRCHLFTLLGAAGVGKSRLVREFEHSLGPEVTVLHGRCLPYGEGITYWPLGEAVRAAAGIEAGDQREAAIGKLAALLGADEDATEVARRLGRAIGLEPGSVAQDEVLWAARRALEALARERPLVVVFDDIQWAEPAFLELVEHVADWSRDAPILLLCPGRPDLLDLRPSWGGGKLNATTVLLEPLRADAAEQLLDELTGEGTLPATLRVRIAAAAEGNPLFVEEMVAMLVDEGALGRDDGRWVLLGEVGELRVPPTIQALLAARLDRLPPDERSVAERASVIGRIFERQAVVALSPLESQPDVPASLMALVRRELLRPDRSELAGDDAFRFRHLLIRDAAYDALPKAERAGLHERFADWLLAAAGDRLAEYEEIVGYHLDQAQRHRAELGQRDAGTAALAERAARHLAAAGGRARDREDTKAAASLLRRAVDLLPADSAEARALLFELAIVQTQGVDIRDARATTRELLERSLAAGDAAMAARARLVESSVRGASDPAYRAHEAQATLQEALALFTERGDRAGLALAWDVDSEIELLAARWTRSFESARRGLEIARELRQTQTADRLMGRMVNAALWGPMPVPEALALADEMLGQVEGRARRAGILDKRALLLAMDGRADEARADRAAALALWEELHGAGVHLGFAGGLVEWTLGDVEGAVDWNGRIAHTMEALGQTGSLSTIAALLGRALLEAGRPEAEVLAEVERCRTLASPDDTVSQAGWRALLALVMIGREDPDEGQLVEADRLSTEAIEILGRADHPSWLADLLLDRATVLLRLGRPEEARAATERALALYEGKGNRPWSERARGRLAELGPG
ncbi:MAG TPA: AAA family ATPase, partial [Candidatus Limnocylindrales bacterium]|nr:AAA family ATPase [Candidatus Limnocylindrales bacterium]